MKGVLDKIVQHKLIEVAEQSVKVPLADLKKDKAMPRSPFSMKQSILTGSGVIAEFKRASPSKGIIREKADPIEITKAYQQAGASGVSVLTDEYFFKGSTNDLKDARSALTIPILRKDFIVDPYQIYEAKSIGADCILLIVAILSKKQIKEYLHIAKDLGLEAIIEIHDAKELDKLSGGEEIIGVNNRNLDTFEVDIQNSILLSGQLGDVVKIAESGLDSGSNLSALKQAGFHGFLVGESFMRQPSPGTACADFIESIQRKDDY